MNNLLNGLMAYRQRAQQRGPMQPQGRPMGGFHPMGQPGMPSTPGGYDSSGINPGGGMPHPMQQNSPMPTAPMGGAPSMPSAPPMQPAPQMPAPPASGGYDSSGINPSAGRPFQLQGGFSKPDPSQNPVLIHNKPASI